MTENPRLASEVGHVKRVRGVTCLRGCHLLSLAAVVLVTISACGQAAPNSWLIRVSGEEGPINAHTTRQDLVGLYGAANVIDRDVDIGEGETQSGTVLFPQDPERSIEILWRDPEKKILPASAEIAGGTSRWRAAHNISLGTSLKELEQLNGRPFLLSGFGWDYSGTVTSWDKGSLTAELDGGHGRVIVRLDAPPNARVSEAQRSQVMGEGDFHSDHPVMQKLNPRAYQIIWIFPPATK